MTHRHELTVGNADWKGGIGQRGIKGRGLGQL